MEEYMKFCVVGINHHIAPIELREKVHFKETDIIECSEILLSHSIEEFVILSTCNRSEVYFLSDDILSDISGMKQFYNFYFHVDIDESYFIAKSGDDAIRHLFNVTVGLDSVAIGEDQILGQVIDAHETAMNLGNSGKTLNKIFREAITFSKSVKTNSDVSNTPISIAYIGVKKISTFVDLSKSKALVIGLGNMGRLASNHLIELGAKVYVSNRTYENSLKMQISHPEVEVLPFESLKDNINSVDVVISATASPHVIINYEHLKDLENHIYILDLSLPRDVDPRVSDLKNITLFDIDSLQEISDQSLRRKREMLESYKPEIDAKIQELNSWKLNRNVDPIMESLNKRCDKIANETLNYIFRKTDLNHSEQKKVDKIVRTALKKVLREPILSINEIEDYNKRESAINILKEVFIK